MVLASGLFVLSQADPPNSIILALGSSPRINFGRNHFLLFTMNRAASRKVSARGP